MKASNHRNGQAALAAEHLGDACATAEDGFQVVLDCLHLVVQEQC